jgi:hypothetical protein
MNYIVNVAAALSQLLNATVFFGDPNETLSGRCYRERIKWAERAINLLFFFQKDHCLKSHLSDHQFAHKILEHRQ